MNTVFKFGQNFFLIFKTLKANREAYIDRIHASYERGFDNNGVERVYDYATFVDAHTVESGRSVLHSAAYF